MNPTQDVLEQRVAALEGGIAALALASGMAAITAAIQTLAEAGDNIVSSTTLYGGTYNLCPYAAPTGHRGPLCRSARSGAFAALIDGRTKAVFCESVGNPLGNITDFEALAALAHPTGCRWWSITPCPAPICADRLSMGPTLSCIP
jgi:O-acetylhomoserine (thiol)-lyase